jgi:hypothetical protein
MCGRGGGGCCVNVIIFGGRGIKNLITHTLNKHNIKRFYAFRFFFHFEVYYQQNFKQVYNQKAKENHG